MTAGPDGHFEWPPAVTGMTALVAPFRFRVGIIPTIAARGAAGLIIRLLAG